MSALMKMLGVDKIMEGLDIDALTRQFESKMREDAKMVESIKQIAADIVEIKKHLGIEADSLAIVDIEFKENA